MKISEVLARAAKLVERGWCQGSTAKARNGDKVVPSDVRAIQWCALGAILRATGPGKPLTECEFFRNFIGQFPIGSWNDTRTRTGPEVATYLSSAAKYAKARGK